MKKNNGRSVTGSKGSVSFVECLEILRKTYGKAPESAKTNIPTSFQNFENFRKSLEKSENVTKCSKQPSSIF